MGFCLDHFQASCGSFPSMFSLSRTSVLLFLPTNCLLTSRIRFLFQELPPNFSSSSSLSAAFAPLFLSARLLLSDALITSHRRTAQVDAGATMMSVSKFTNPSSTTNKVVNFCWPEDFIVCHSKCIVDLELQSCSRIKSG